ncbi:hypothetical protein CKO51_20485 [Rhodopirellula sp. SM50]|nr:hypothetical protein CKO51_20485 [Rhodopirellula sp. SM50]
MGEGKLAIQRRPCQNEEWDWRSGELDWTTNEGHGDGAERSEPKIVLPPLFCRCSEDGGTIVQWDQLDK